MSTNDALIRIQGNDAGKFLQGQLTCDIEQLKDGEWSLGAHCNPKGRVISLFKITRLSDDFILLLPASMVEIAITALKKYAIFFKTTIEVENNHTIANLKAIPEQQYKCEQITAGIPGIYPETSEKYLPHELNLPQLGGVSFEKGCYTGQEIISRMQHLGKLKKQLHRVNINQTGLVPGQDFIQKDTIIGNIIDCCETGKNESLALLLTDDINRDQLNILD